jgi:CheY-like chemotaxis protein
LANELAPGAIASGLDAARPPKHNRLTLLCVDDDLDTRKFLQVTLEDYGFRVVPADGYDSALSLAKACQPDLVCLDMKLQGKGGSELMDAFAMDEDLRHLPVIIVSGETRESHSPEPASQGFIAKPIDPIDLVNHVHAALASHLKSVLIVEDNDDFQRLLTESFEDHGAQVFNASNGKEALAVLRKCEPSAIITDLKMPEMDGVEFLQTLRSHEIYSRIPVIVLTARTLGEKTRESLSDLCHEVLTKGLDSTAHIIVAAIRAGKPVESPVETSVDLCEEAVS